MTHRIHCVKLNKEAEGLTQPPLPGELGKTIYDSISKEAWQLWLNHQIMLINEYRLSTIDPKARAFLLQEMESFLFGTGSSKPIGYVKPEK
ncbi:MAG TPA: oxidative damage protection protein [Gammaproteobacteria bacterium]|nr:oxidative damage protection protein [Gammaproteobacteria bacterium]